jgi:hypothetical protein
VRGVAHSNQGRICHASLAADRVRCGIYAGACGGADAPTATPEPNQVPAGDISTLLLPSDLGVDGLTTEQVDQKANAAAVDPGQITRMGSFVTLTFTTAGRTQHLVLTTLDFDSVDAAVGHAALMMGPDCGMLALSPVIGDQSAYIEANAGWMGSFVAFAQGEWVVTLHTAQADGVTPLVGQEELAALGELVASRL